jgi:hypothetical protein
LSPITRFRVQISPYGTYAMRVPNHDRADEWRSMQRSRA